MVYTFLPGEVNEQLPEVVPGHGIDARCGFVEDQNFGFMNGGNSKRQTLADAQRKAFRLVVHDIGKSELDSHFLHPGRNILIRHIEEMRVHIQILPNG